MLESFILIISIATGNITGEQCEGVYLLDHLTGYGQIDVDCKNISSSSFTYTPVTGGNTTVRLNALEFQGCTVKYSYGDSIQGQVISVDCPGFYSGVEKFVKGE